MYKITLVAIVRQPLPVIVLSFVSKSVSKADPHTILASLLHNFILNNIYINSVPYVKWWLVIHQSYKVTHNVDAKELRSSKVWWPTLEWLQQIFIKYVYRLQRITISGNAKHTYRTLCEVQQVQCCIECFITSTHEEQNGFWCVVDAHYGILWQINELVTCLTLQQAPGNIQQNISIILVAHTYNVSVRTFSIIAGIYWLV